MKKLFKKITVFLLLMLSVQGTVLAAGETITVHNTKENGLYMSINSETVDLGDAKIFIDDNWRTQMPVRAVSELLNATVDWNDTSRTVTVTRENTTLTLTIGQEYMYKNGEKIQMDTAAVIVDDKTYIPLKYIGEGLDCLVVYTDGDEPFKGKVHSGIDENFFG